ncbi:MAG TPA: serine hydrolase [Candidatus Saccharimonadales bacterium]|nr:serine hydrolase [Candidatus Saccharimonadales bacterium]
MKHLKLLLIGVLLVSNLVTIAFLVREKNDSPANAYPYIDLARNFIPQEHFIVNIQPLREELQKLVREEGADTISIYFEFLNTGANIQINNDARFYPASLVKLPTAMVAMKKIERGEWKRNNMLVLFEEDKDNRYGQLHEKPVGTKFTIEELLQALLIESDNTAHRMLMRNLGERELGELKDDIGLDDLFNERQEISAKEYSRIFRSLYNSSFLSREGSQQILEWLTQTRFNKTLSSGVPQGTPFAHKIGEDDVEKNYLDSGIVYLPNRPYLITVMVKGQDQEKAELIMKQASKAAYDYVKNYK